MIVLGLETATPQVGCALGDDEGPVASFQLCRGRRHAETLVPAIENLCRQSGITLDQVGAVAVDVGPGLFTGLRVGVATGQAMAAALGIPMVALTSLDLLAHPQRRGAGLIASVVDARRGEVFWALYRPGSDGVRRISDYAVSSPGEMATQLPLFAAPGEEVLAVGDGARRYAELLGAALSGAEVHVQVGPPSTAHPSPAVLVELAHPLAVRGEVVSAGELAPLYLRQADVRIGWVERDRPAGSPAALAAGSIREAG